MDFQQIDERCGVRLSFNIVPQNEVYLQQTHIPLSIHYTPTSYQKGYPPIQCACGCYESEFNTHNVNCEWNCNFCGRLNGGIKKQELKSAVQFELQNCKKEHAVLFVLDIERQDYEGIIHILKNNKHQQSMNVGIIFYCRYMYIYNFQIKSFFVIDRQLNPHQISSILALKQARKHYFSKLHKVQNQLVDIIRSFREDFETEKNQRILKATGMVIQNIASFTYWFPSLIIRVCIFITGPCTTGKHKLVQQSLKVSYRTIQQLSYQKHSNQYQEIVAYFILRNTVIDVFAITLDQIGLYQIHKLILKTGGIMVIDQQFQGTISQTFYRLYEDFNYGMCTKIKFYKHINLQIQKVIGPGLKNAMNQGQSFQWIMASTDPSATITIYLKIKKRLPKTLFFQFITQFINLENKTTKRILSFQRETSRKRQVLLRFFDQQAVISSIAKNYSIASFQQEYVDVMKRIDRILFNFLKYACDRRKNSQIYVPKLVKLLPQYVYNLRKAPVLNPFGKSPDQISYYRFWLIRQSVANTTSMIQPVILKYTIDKPIAAPVSLNIRHLDKQCIIVLDSFFNLVYWQGIYCYKWRQQGYMQTYQHIKQMYLHAEQDIKSIIESRLLFSKFIRTKQDDSQQRYLKSKLHQNKKRFQQPSLLTDDISLQQFTNYLYAKIKEI